VQKVVISLVTPHKSLQSRAAFFFSLAGALIFVSTLTQRGALAIQAIGASTLGFAFWITYAAIRIRGWKDFRVELDEDALLVPEKPLVRREMTRIPLTEIQMVSYAGTGDVPRIEILSRTGLTTLPFSWFPKTVSPSELGLRVHIRSQLARAREALEPAELAALEATMIAGKSYGAYVIERLGETPEIVATLDSSAEKEALAPDLKGKGAKLIDCSERIRALRDALERGLAAPSLLVTKSKSE